MTKSLREGEVSVEAGDIPTAPTHESQSRHTPGPWALSDVRAFGRRKVEAWVQEPSGHRWRKTLAAMLDGNLDEGEADANARLIVAAPDLLDELDTLCQAIEGHRAGALTNDGLWHYREKARAEIAKAEGR